jgi:phage-related tail protein
MTDAAKRFEKVHKATAMIWKMLQVSKKNFSTLKGHWLLPDVYRGKTYVDGVLKRESKKTEKVGRLNSFYTPIYMTPSLT